MPRPTMRSQLQRAIGELGEILPYVPHATRHMKAPGWYARLRNDELVYLGGDGISAAQTIERLLDGQDLRPSQPAGRSADAAHA